MLPKTRVDCIDLDWWINSAHYACSLLAHWNFGLFGDLFLDPNDGCKRYVCVSKRWTHKFGSFEQMSTFSSRIGNYFNNSEIWAKLWNQYVEWF